MGCGQESCMRQGAKELLAAGSTENFMFRTSSGTVAHAFGCELVPSVVPAAGSLMIRRKEDGALVGVFGPGELLEVRPALV